MLFFKPSSFVSFFLLALQFQPSTQAAIQPSSSWHNGKYPQRIIAGVPVIDTPLVRAAQELARNHSSEAVYKHVMRSWLFGAGIIANNATLNRAVDKEVHAVAALLHDLGWDDTPGSPFVSPDKRFEVDGANAARDFIKNFKQGKKWNAQKTQLLWDAIALHTIESIFDYKEPEVQTTGSGIQVDFIGPHNIVPQEVYNDIIAEFPNDDLKEGTVGAFVWLCKTKPKTTYDGPLQTFGEKLVANYSAVGHRTYDLLFPPSSAKK